MIGAEEYSMSNHLYIDNFGAGGACGSINPVAETVTVVLLMLLGEIEGLINLIITIVTLPII